MEGPSASQLCSMFPTLSAAVVEDVLQQCEGCGNRALEALLGMQGSAASPRGLLTCGPQALAQAMFAPVGAPEFCAQAGWAADQGASGTPYLDPAFGSFVSDVTHSRPDGHSQDGHRSWWPPWPADPSIAPTSVSRLASPSPVPASIRAFSPELPSAEGWGTLPDEELNSGATSSTQSPPTTPLNLDGSPVDATDSPELSDSELAEALPHLVPLLNHSPVGSPPDSSRRVAPQPEAVPLPFSLDGAATLDKHVDPSFFPNLSPEIVWDVLARYDTNTGIKHLMMLNTAVASGGTAAAAREVPDEASWGCDTASSSGDEAQPVCDGLTPLEKLEILKQEFPGINPTECSSVLAICEGKLEAAAELLRTFAAEDESPAVEPLAAGMAGLALSEPAAPGPEEAEKMQQLCSCFRGVPEEYIQVALVSVAYNVGEAHRLLLEQGYTEVVEAPQLPPAPAAQLAAAAPGPSALPAPLPLPTAGLSLSEATYLRNEQIYTEEREYQRRLVEARNKCRAMAAAHHQRGEYALADQLYRQAAKYKQQMLAEGRLASRRISKRVNDNGSIGHVLEDLHGKHVSEVLDTVSEQIRSLPKLFSRGVFVEYITGKGNHSTGGAKLRPALMELLAQHGIEFEELPGRIVAKFVPE